MTEYSFNCRTAVKTYRITYKNKVLKREFKSDIPKIAAMRATSYISKKYPNEESIKCKLMNIDNEKEIYNVKLIRKKLDEPIEIDGHVMTYSNEIKLL